jgi:hypothetical protein
MSVDLLEQANVCEANIREQDMSMDLRERAIGELVNW